jgi:hypothetical protein
MRTDREDTWQLSQFGSERAAAYLRQGLPSMQTFAEKALDGIEVRWTSNPVERAMEKSLNGASEIGCSGVGTD